MTIGQTIRALRKKAGLTQNQLGALCGITGGAVSRYENGVTTPKRRTAEKLAAALGVSLGRLQGEPPPAPQPSAPDSGGGLLYAGVLSVLKELYGAVEGRVILGEGGRSRRYYLIRQLPGDFVLYEDDIKAIVRSARASMTPLAAYMQSARAGGGL